MYCWTGKVELFAPQRGGILYRYLNADPESVVRTGVLGPKE